MKNPATLRDKDGCIKTPRAVSGGVLQIFLATLKHTLLVFVVDTVDLCVGGMDNSFTHKVFVYLI